MKDKGGNRDQNHQKGKAKRDDAESLCQVKKMMPAFACWRPPYQRTPRGRATSRHDACCGGRNKCHAMSRSVTTTPDHAAPVSAAKIESEPSVRAGLRACWVEMAAAAGHARSSR